MQINKPSSRNLLNLVLFIVVVALILVVVFKPGKEDEDMRRLSSLDKNLVTELTIERTGNPKIQFKKVENQWKMISPYNLKANSIKLESLLDLLDYEYKARYDMAELDSKQYGLDIPRTTITFNNTNKFEFGTTEPINKYRYIRHQGGLYLTDDYYYHRVLGNASSFLDHALLDNEVNITKIEIPGLSLTMKDGKWLAQPKPEKFSNDQANELIEHWKHSHAIEMLAYPPVKGTGQVRLYIDKKESPLRFDIFSFNDEFYLGRADLKIAYKLAKEQRRDLLTLPPAINTPDSKPATK